jgi:hypothetical protein
MIVEHHRDFLDRDDIREIQRMFERCPASSNRYQNRDTELLHELFRSSVFRKIKKSLLQDQLVCEAWFIVGDKYSWHTDIHVDLFSDHVLNIWIPCELSPEDDAPVLEYYEKGRLKRRRVRKPKWMLSSLVATRSAVEKMLPWANLGPWVDRLFSFIFDGELRQVEHVRLGDVLVLDPSFVHRSGSRGKKVLALQCVPEKVLQDPNVCHAHSSYTSRVARKALAAIYLQERS